VLHAEKTTWKVFGDRRQQSSSLVPERQLAPSSTTGVTSNAANSVDGNVSVFVLLVVSYAALIVCLIDASFDV